MKNIYAIELHEDELDIIAAAGAKSFFKKIGSGIETGCTKAGKAVGKAGLKTVQGVVVTVEHTGSIIHKAGIHIGNFFC